MIIGVAKYKNVSSTAKMAFNQQKIMFISNYTAIQIGKLCLKSQVCGTLNFTDAKLGFNYAKRNKEDFMLSECGATEE